MTISDTALAKIREHQRCMELKEDYNAKDFSFYDVGFGSYGISPHAKWRWRKDNKRCDPIKDFDDLKKALDLMSGGKWKVYYLDEDEHFDNLNEFLEYYYITKLAGI